MKIIKLKNVQDIYDVYSGQGINPGEYYTLQSEQEINNFACDAKVNEHIHSNPAKLIVNDGENDLSSVLGGLWLTSNNIQKVTIQSQPSFGSKTLPTGERLIKRVEGVQVDLVEGTNTINYSIPWNWVKITGVEIVGCESLDVADLFVMDNAIGTFSGTPNAMLNQFAFTINLSKDFYEHRSEFDADLYKTMVLKCTYVSKTAKTIGVNFILNEVIS